MPPKNQRRSHTKSKKGCSQCKIRRIKCNEQRPTCSACERRDIACDFSVLTDDHGLQRSESQTETSPGHMTSNGSLSSSTRQLDPFQVADLISTGKSTDLAISDLRLMHHFTAELAPNLANHHTAEALALWQVHTVNLGFKHDFLLRGVLAVAAFHLGYLHPHLKTEYDLQASTHQSIALASFKDNLEEVNESNCHALFVFSCLIIIMAFASSSKDQASDFQTDVLHWFYLLRGCNMVLKMHTEALRNSFLKPLLDEMTYSETTAAHAIPNADRITDLFRVCNVSQHEREVSQAYTFAIHSLLSTFIQASLLRMRGEGTVLASFVWPINLPPKFLELLSEKQPEAMIILGHYCVLIHWGAIDDTWFMAGWARYMLDTIKDSVSAVWQEHLRWPEEVIG